jgi:hypothetical protein
MSLWTLSKWFYKRTSKTRSKKSSQESDSRNWRFHRFAGWTEFHTQAILSKRRCSLSLFTKKLKSLIKKPKPKKEMLRKTNLSKFTSTSKALVNRWFYNLRNRKKEWWDHSDPHQSHPNIIFRCPNHTFRIFLRGLTPLRFFKTKNWVNSKRS